MSQSLSEEPSKLSLVAANVAAGAFLVGFVAIIAPLYLVSVICNLPKALEDWDAARRHHKNRQ